MAEEQLVTKEAKISFIQNKMRMWRNTQYDATLDLRVATKIGNAEGIKNAEEYFKRCEIALMELEEALKEVA